MEISILKAPVNGKLEVSVRYYDQIEELGHSATLTVWVQETDSRKELEARAREAAHAFLQRCVSAHAA
jgi:hypothetical protein